MDSLSFEINENVHRKKTACFIFLYLMGFNYPQCVNVNVNSTVVRLY